MSEKTSQSGSSLIEVAIVTFFLLVVFTALISIVTMSVSRNRQAKERAVATRLAQEAAEWLRFERDRLGFKAVDLNINEAGETLCLDSFPTLPEGLDDIPNAACAANELVLTKFTRQAVLSTDHSSIAYTVTVTWPKAGGTPDTVTITGVLNQWDK